MPFYHVRVDPKSKQDGEEVRLDLSREELETRFLLPYRTGKPIVINGKTMEVGDIGRIRVSETEQNADQLRPAAEWRNREHYSFVIPGPSIESIIAYMGEDVTDQFITGPHGEEAPTDVGDKGKHRPSSDSRVVFVVHGRNCEARDALFDFLRAIALHPLEWSEAIQATGKSTPFI